MAGPFEIRDPIHGFIELDDWERDIVNHPVFQRLRRIRQLGLTDMVYPGATHSRFEHSLGVMHVATRMFEAIVDRRRDFLRAAYKYDDAGLARDKRILRLAALLHDVGHAPFSHGGEGLMPEIEKDRQFGHEQYSAAIVANLMRDVIESHPLNQNHEIKAQDIADFLEGKASVGRRLLWANLVDGQLDADRADYLLRDSHHIGVTYGHFDLQRLLTTLTVVEDSDRGSPAFSRRRRRSTCCRRPDHRALHDVYTGLFSSSSTRVRPPLGWSFANVARAIWGFLSSTYRREESWGIH